MKKFLITFLVYNAIVFGQVSADLTIENQHVVGTDFFFDMYLTRTLTADVYLGTADFALSFNSSAFTNPTIAREPDSFWNLMSTSGFSVGTLYRAATSPAEIMGNNLIINLNTVDFGDQMDFNDNVAKIDNTPVTHRIGRYKVSGITNSSAYMELQWKIAGAGLTTQAYTWANVTPWVSTVINLNAIDPPNAPLSSAPTTFQLSVSVTNGWNMVSIPGLHPTNQDVLTWWPGKDPTADVFKFLGGYTAVTTVTPGTGYWMKHIGANTYSTGDEWPSSGINIVPHNPISAITGWNLIGGYEFDAAVSGITTTPPGLQDSPVYGYSGGYQVVNFLIPGYGFWIKLSGPGLINLPSTLSKENFETQSTLNEDWGRIIISDESGQQYTLYTVNDQVNLDDYELPPLPPSGMFDVRYGSGRFVENLNSEKKSIEMNGVNFPIVIHTENMSIRIQDETGKQVNSSIKSGEELTIANSVSRLFVSSDLIPDKYFLEQNYPNPFNPSTKIEFSLAEDVVNVSLIIYNTLGQKVAELVNSKLEAGTYSYLWNAEDVSSGIYVYELKTENFVSVKKMVLMK
jgi:hypothetical protein